MRKRVIFLLLLGLFCNLTQGSASVDLICNQKDCVAVERVTKPEDLERGLMFRKGLDEDKGMLFVFQTEDIYKFWMKNMVFNLDILWINSIGKIVYLAQDVLACTKEPCAIYSPGNKASYVLELKSGYCKRHHWQTGDVLKLDK